MSKPMAKKNAKIALPQATIGETLSFVFECGPKMSWIFFAGILGAIANGTVYPILAFKFANAFIDFSRKCESSNVVLPF